MFHSSVRYVSECKAERGEVVKASKIVKTRTGQFHLDQVKPEWNPGRRQIRKNPVPKRLESEPWQLIERCLCSRKKLVVTMSVDIQRAVFCSQFLVCVNYVSGDRNITRRVPSVGWGWRQAAYHRKKRKRIHVSIPLISGKPTGVD